MLSPLSGARRTRFQTQPHEILAPKRKHPPRESMSCDRGPAGLLRPKIPIGHFARKKDGCVTRNRCRDDSTCLPAKADLLQLRHRDSPLRKPMRGFSLGVGAIRSRMASKTILN